MRNLVRSTVVLMLVCCVVPIMNARQDSVSANISFDETLLSDSRMIVGDAGRIFSAPARFSEKDWIVAGSIVGGTVLLFTVDESARSFARRNHSAFNDDLFNVGKEYGKPIYGLALSGGLYLGGAAFHDKDIRLTGMMVLESLAFSAVITNVVKSLAGRSRPFLEEGSTRFRGLQFEDGTTSLPSGHATVAFAVSSVLAERIHSIFATIGFYSLATLTAASRVYHDEHWVSDAVLGAAIGTTIGISVAHLHDDHDNGSSLQFTPSPAGLRIVMNF